MSTRSGTSRRVAAILVALLFLPAVGAVRRVLAANCAFSGVRVLTTEVPRDGAVVVEYVCSGFEDCEPPGDLRVERDGVAIAGDVQTVHSSPTQSLVVFRPAEPFSLEGTHRIVTNRMVLTEPRTSQPLDAFGVSAEAASQLDLEGLAVEIRLENRWRPRGDTVCCPSHGEGDCDLACGGLDGEQYVAVVSAAVGPAPASELFRLLPSAASEDGTGFVQAIDGVRLETTFDATVARYCVRLETWNVHADSRQMLERCVPAPESELAVGQTRASWDTLGLDSCSAPPIVGNWGYDVLGVPRPGNYEVAPEPLRLAWCERRQDCARVAEDASCEHYAHYCPEYLAGAGEGGDASAGAGNEGASEVDAGEPDGGPAQRRTRPSTGCGAVAGNGSADQSAILFIALVLLKRRPRLRRRR